MAATIFEFCFGDDGRRRRRPTTTTIEDTIVLWFQLWLVGVAALVITVFGFRATVAKARAEERGFSCLLVGVV